MAKAFDGEKAYSDFVSVGFLPSVCPTSTRISVPGVCLRCGQPGNPKPSNLTLSKKYICQFCARNKVDPAIAEGKMLAMDFLPSVPYPGGQAKWPGVCLNCGRAGSPTYSRVNRGDSPCAYCSRRRVDDDIALGKMLARDFLPSTPYTKAKDRWLGVCLKCGNPGKPSYADVRNGDGPCGFCAGHKQDDAIILGKQMAKGYILATHIPLSESQKQRRKHGVSRVDPAEAFNQMLSHSVLPSIPFPGVAKPWASVCLRCGNAISPALSSVRNGQGACKYCSGQEVDDAIRVGKALARGLVVTVQSLAGRRLIGYCMDCGRPRQSNPSKVSPCSYCIGHKVDEDIAFGKMMAAGFMPLEPYPGGKVGWKSACVDCGTLSYPRYNNVICLLSRCSTCSSTGYRQGMPGALYAVMDPDQSIIKLGVSNLANLPRRLLSHARQGLTKVLFVREEQDGAIPLKLERRWIEYVKVNDSYAVSKDALPDGYTEAIYVHDGVWEYVAGIFAAQA